ncbi:hypothetical protein K7640_24570 [Micromonospora sp. PLK6-60]|uniref:hypothetical protein n=1 Tax=Micromonospora sp. PLK6-60 TaxID=2873383 RepID=UPI001CA606A5|nr:hypothetical protein [Micromonospora sp. PLK6-60]MBY8875008.1 hypothetical protein [Micromonospora sp. PLK6-60]
MMSLTGTPLLLLTALATVAAATATATGWHRGRRTRLLLRTAALLLTQALALTCVGLAVNRSQHFYTSWDDLLHTSAAAAHANPDRPGRLDRWLTHHGDTGPTTLDWRPPRWRTWHLTTDPTVVVPAGYPHHPTWRYPALVVLDQDPGTRTTPPVDGAVLVLIHPGAHTSVDTLTTTLPEDLQRDLRVTGHTWALVATGHHRLARAVAAAAPTRYRALALTGPATDPPGPTPTVSHTTAPDLTAALRWAAAQTPLPGPAPPTPPSAGPR